MTKLFKSSYLRFSYFPLWMCVFGYLEFLWQTLGTSPFSLGLVSTICVLAVFILTGVVRFFVVKEEGKLLLKGFLGEGGWILRLSLFLCLSLMLLEFGLALFSATRPPHLPQEYDAIHYQMGIPRQLLLAGSLRWISWSVADLWPMAMQWSMAPLYLFTDTVNKIPHFVLSCGIFVTIYRIAEKLMGSAESRFSLLLPGLAFFSAHGVMIQMGTGMMDLPVVYFLVAGFLALLHRNLFVAALALAFYTGSKAFHPFQMAAVLGCGILWIFLFCRSRIVIGLVLKFLLFFVFLAGAFLSRSSLISVSATGTPLFPFGVCLFKEATLCSEINKPLVENSAKELLATRDRYGKGRGFSAFGMHLLYVGVPTFGVNNEYDYPVGLPWYLLIILLFFSVLRGSWNNPLFFLSIGFWVLWWMSSHQSRWLYPFLVFGFLATIKEQMLAKKALAICLVFSFSFSLISQIRSLKPTLHLSRLEIQKIEAGKPK